MLRITKKVKEDREMSCCEDSDPYPSKIDGHKKLKGIFLPADEVRSATG